MKEIQEILKAIKIATEQEKSFALATVVKVEGSAYRRAGARMLVTEDGELTGAISGGCLEGDALRKALYVMSEQKPMLVTYDTNDEDDAKLGVGLGCNGIIHILIEPINIHTKNNPAKILSCITDNREVAIVITLFSLDSRSAKQFGTIGFVSKSREIFSDSLAFAHKSELVKIAEEALQTELSRTINLSIAEEKYIAFIEVIRPAIQLNIIGAGNDAIPLVKIAHLIGWEINVIDGRPALLHKSRFPEAKERIVAKAEQVLEVLPIDKQTVFVLMTHNYNYELAVLRNLISIDIPYVGILGPKKKFNRMIHEIQDEGIVVTNEHLKKVYAPVGLDLGSETSEEIALSIVAEIKAVLSGKVAGFLKDKEGPIHEVQNVEVSKAVF